MNFQIFKFSVNYL